MSSGSEWRRFGAVEQPCGQGGRQKEGWQSQQGQRKSLCHPRTTLPPLPSARPAGVWVGIHRDPQMLVLTLRSMRRQVDINTEVGVVHDIRLQVRGQVGVGRGGGGVGWGEGVAARVK